MDGKQQIECIALSSDMPLNTTSFFQRRRWYAQTASKRGGPKHDNKNPRRNSQEAVGAPLARRIFPLSGLEPGEICHSGSDEKSKYQPLHPRSSFRLALHNSSAGTRLLQPLELVPQPGQQQIDRWRHCAAVIARFQLLNLGMETSGSRLA